ncbi:type I pantothenate kinase [Nanchangia anserum]|uniref:Pantothenate kinase n=1 Tax=Nanchangia anserum TaxID=2692125 RepID=A0A8I0KQG4_9ACTO|nr:type I pantothenate kinase [Nanchangia anserum]MBD3689960.1 type I pantothenate kinase [Nanchangia anserum]
MPQRGDKHTGSFWEKYSRAEWARLAQSTPYPLTQADVTKLAALGDPIGPVEADQIYRPLAQLLQIHYTQHHDLARSRSRFLGRPRADALTPFVIGVAGSVAVGKSTTARLLQELLRRWPSTPRVELVTTDGFLYPNAELARRGIAHRKGFPESYDRRTFLRFLANIKSGVEVTHAPVYSHVIYDITDEVTTVRRPDIVIIEGLNVLQPARPHREASSALAVSDFFDFSIYVDARPADIEQWYVERFLRLKQTAFLERDSYFRRYADISDDIARDIAHNIWASINLPNLVDNIAPTRSRANLILRKGPDHHVHRILLRKI